jgi:bisphosphoglycerate-independent phosphoglycerate mutase (AlkP superfamily)
VKFGHVTFFWNGNRSGYFDETKEEYVEIPSDIGITFNVKPNMKALEIAEKARDAILSGKFDQVGNCFVGAQMTVCLYKMLLKIFITLLGTCQPAEW